MSKETKKEQTNFDCLHKDLEKNVSELNKLFKDGGFRLLGSDDVQDIPRISSGVPELDKSLGGGWPRGKIIELYGHEASGKTWILSKTYAACQKAGLKCLHFDVEQSFNLKFAEMNGVNMDFLGFYQPAIDDYAENILEKIEKICQHGLFDVIGIDSIGAFIPKDELEASIEDQQMGLLARVMSKAIRKITNAAANGNVTVIFINQIRNKIGVLYGNPEDTMGGKALKFFSSVRVEATRRLKPKADCPEIFEGTTRIGHILHTKVVKNRTAPPFGEAEVVLLYKPRRTVIQFLFDGIEKGLIEQNKSNHKKLKIGEKDVLLTEKGDLEQLLDIMRSSNLLLPFFDKLVALKNDFEKIIRDGDLTEEKVGEYTNKKKAA